MGARLRGAGVLAALLLCLPLAACAPGTEPITSGGLTRSSIDVDTPSLRSEKKEAGIAACPTSSAPALDAGLPDITLPCFGGGRDVRLSGLRGPLLVNVWGSYCAPCRTEMPILEQFHQRYGDQIGVLGIDFQDAQTESAMTLATRSKVTYPLVADPQSLLAEPSTLRIRGLPTTAFVAADGTIAHVQAFEITSIDQLTAMVKRSLGIDL